MANFGFQIKSTTSQTTKMDLTLLLISPITVFENPQKGLILPSQLFNCLLGGFQTETFNRGTKNGVPKFWEISR